MMPVLIDVLLRSHRLAAILAVTQTAPFFGSTGSLIVRSQLKNTSIRAASVPSDAHEPQTAQRLSVRVSRSAAFGELNDDGLPKGKVVVVAGAREELAAGLECNSSVTVEPQLVFPSRSIVG